MKQKSSPGPELRMKGRKRQQPRANIECKDRIAATVNLNCYNKVLQTW
jgi:hypothetical protein